MNRRLWVPLLLVVAMAGCTGLLNTPSGDTFSPPPAVNGSQVDSTELVRGDLAQRSNHSHRKVFSIRVDVADQSTRHRYVQRRDGNLTHLSVPEATLYYTPQWYALAPSNGESVPPRYVHGEAETLREFRSLKQTRTAPGSMVHPIEWRPNGTTTLNGTTVLELEAQRYNRPIARQYPEQYGALFDESETGVELASGRAYVDESSLIRKLTLSIRFSTSEGLTLFTTYTYRLDGLGTTNVTEPTWLREIPHVTSTLTANGRGLALTNSGGRAIPAGHTLKVDVAGPSAAPYEDSTVTLESALPPGDSVILYLKDPDTFSGDATLSPVGVVRESGSVPGTAAPLTQRQFEEIVVGGSLDERLFKTALRPPPERADE